MRLLIDSQVFVWLDIGSPKLPARVKRHLEHTENEIFLSLASIWELQIKESIGKLSMRRSITDLVEAHCAQNGLSVLPIQLSHIAATARLPDLHRDPFDRLLIAQAMTEDLQFVTADAVIEDYPVQVLW